LLTENYTALMAKNFEIPKPLESIEEDNVLKDLKKEFMNFGGAVRVNYSYTNYQTYADNKDRMGDIDFDMFRLDYDGQKDGVILSAQIRFFQYMYAIRHAWVGFDTNSKSQFHIGVVPMPFGAMPYNSNNFFFSANYYLGLEDTHASGMHWQYKEKNFDIDLGFYKNDDLGGIDGYVENRNRSYTYSIVGVGLDGNNSVLRDLGESNTVHFRYAHKFLLNDKCKIELGVSGLHGAIVDATTAVGKRDAYALHTVVDVGALNVKLQATQYNINLDDQSQKIAIGAYAWNDEIASKTTSYTAHLAYKLKKQLGLIKNITLYNDYSLLTHKSTFQEDTIMNDTGVSFSAGKTYTYVDFIVAKNMPFIGGSMVGDTLAWSYRMNINMGYYF
ncbi:MAG: hypothetical protein OEW60_03240, partial [Thiovulaceae bacterium]|nr:hypothetical protein [Sulfurimonadaceae bacterium]